MNFKRRIHPNLRNNYVPRILASSLFVLTAFAEFQSQSKSIEVWLMLVFTLSWPHIARFMPFLSKESKHSELVNMLIDAVFSAIFVVLLSTYQFAGLVIAILVANALFIGFFKLLFSTLAIFLSLLLVWHFGIASIEFKPANIASQVIGGAFVVIYYSTFASMGFHLTRNMIRLNKQVESLSQIDPLTGSYNRLYLDKKLQSELHRSNRLEYPLSIIFADIDHFKKINDDYGHAAGDNVLKEFVILINSVIREDVDWVARYGGEEFVIVLPNLDEQNSIEVAERIQAKLCEKKIHLEGGFITISSSFGVASKTPGSGESSKIIDDADKALYLAKHAGRNCIKTVTKSVSKEEPNEIFD